MAILYTPQTAGVFDGTRPPLQAPGNVQTAKVKSLKASIDLANLAVTTADQVMIGMLPSDAKFEFGIINASATMGTAVLAIGTNPVHASNGQYRAAGTFTAVETPTLFGLTAAQAAAATEVATPLYLTVATANLPGAGRLDITIFFNTRV